MDLTLEDLGLDFGLGLVINFASDNPDCVFLGNWRRACLWTRPRQSFKTFSLARIACGNCSLINYRYQFLPTLRKSHLFCLINVDFFRSRSLTSSNKKKKNNSRWPNNQKDELFSNYLNSVSGYKRLTYIQIVENKCLTSLEELVFLNMEWIANLSKFLPVTSSYPSDLEEKWTLINIVLLFFNMNIDTKILKIQSNLTEIRRTDRVTTIGISCFSYSFHDHGKEEKC